MAVVPTGLEMDWGCWTNSAGAGVGVGAQRNMRGQGETQGTPLNEGMRRGRGKGGGVVGWGKRRSKRRRKGEGIVPYWASAWVPWTVSKSYVENITCLHDQSLI